MAQSTDPSAMMEPTERSIPPVRITRLMPTATIPLFDTCRSTSDRLPVLRKILTPLDEAGDVIMPTARRIIRLQYSLVLSRKALNASEDTRDNGLPPIIIALCAGSAACCGPSHGWGALRPPVWNASCTAPPGDA